MTIYSVGVAKTAAATGTAIAMIRPAASTEVQVREIGVFNTTAIATSVGLIRNLTTGTPSTSTLVQAGDPDRPAGTSNVDTAWSVAPTIGSIYLRKIVLPATIGAGIIWTFGPGDLWAGNGIGPQLLLWNFGAGTSAALEVYVVLDE